MRAFWLLAALGLGGCMSQQSTPLGSAGLRQAGRNYPPLIIGSNTDTPSGPVTPRACPAAGSRVEQKGGPTMEYLGAAPTSPNLCVMRVDGQQFQAWYGIWLTDWPGVEDAYPALTNVMRGGTGTVVAFDTRTGPDNAYHDLIRNEGVEHINLLGKIYDAIKISHYREGADGNTYRSVATVWKDLPTGLLVYATYQHISGTPVIDDPLLPTAILPAR